MGFLEIGMGWIVVIFVAAVIFILATAPPIGPNSAKRMRNRTYGRTSTKDGGDGGDVGFDSDSDGGGDGGGD